MKHNEQEIKAMVKKAYSAATPDVLESVLSDCKKLKGRVTPMKKKNTWARFAAAAASAPSEEGAGSCCRFAATKD